MTKKIINAKIVLPYGVVEGDVIIRDGLIASVEAGGASECSGKSVCYDEVIDAEGCYLLAGFVDIHCHGGFGYDFMDATPDEMGEIERFHLSHGTTTLVATTMTDTWENIEGALSRFGEHLPDAITLHGVHLEGPWFSPSQCGAQSVEAMSKPSPKKLLELCRKYPFIERFSIAPDIDDGYETGRAGAALGKVVAIGHTDADFDTTVEAASNGYSLVTHAYSGMNGVVRVNAYRVAGAVEGSLYDDRLTTEVIADGKHLPEGLLKLIYKCKGADRICLITDSMRGAGMPEGATIMLGRLDGGNLCIIEDGVAKLPDRTSFAGSVCTTDRLFRTMVKLAGVPITEVSKMISATPARVMGYADRGEIAEGKRADFVIMDEELNIKNIILKGEKQK